MPRTYRKPPLVEAACELRFKSDTAWDWTFPGIIYEQIRADFPEKRQQAGFEVSVAAGATAVVPIQVPTNSVNRMQFVKQDGSAMVQLGPHLLAVNLLPPYPLWPEFKRLVLQQLETYRRVANPQGFARIGLRYINRVTLPIRTELKDYLRALPETPEELPQVWSAFAMSVNVAYADPPATLRVVVGNVPSDRPEIYPVLLDLDLFHEGDDLPTLDGIEQWLQTAHGRVEQAFDAAVTEKTHAEVFEEVHE
jgi:uncharacterized protein (TIGR04255 family)